MTALIVVVCTGRGSHKRHTFNEITVTPDALQCNRTRVANMPDLKGQMLDGEEVAGDSPAYALALAYNPRQPSGGWRWDCPACAADERFADDDGVRRWLASINGRVADISLRT